MKFSCTIVALAAFAATAVAAPISEADSDTDMTAVSRKFKLRSKVIGGKAAFDGQFLTA